MFYSMHVIYTELAVLSAHTLNDLKEERQMSTNRKLASTALSVGLVSAMLLTACTGGGDRTDMPAGDTAGQGGEGTGQTASDKPAEIVFYSSNNNSKESFDATYGDALRKKFPHYTISYIWSGAPGNKLPELLASNTRFDVFMQAPGHYEAQAFPVDIQYDMTELVKKHQVDLNRLDDTSVDYVRTSSKGQLYFLPIQLDAMVLYYNKSLFDKFGVEYPTDGMTWEQMMDKARKLTRTEGGIQYYGFSTDASTIQGMNPLSLPLADLATDTPTINKDDRWKRFFERFYDEPRKMPGYLEAIKQAKGIPTLQHFVNNQNVAMFAYQSGLINVWTEQLKALNWDIVSLPTFPEQRNTGSMATPQLFGITKMAKDKDAAMNALHYLLSDEFQAELARKGIVPVLKNGAIKDQLGKQSVYADRNWKALFVNKFAPLAGRPAYYSQLNSIYIKYFKQAALDETDLNSALRLAEEEAVKAIAAFKAGTQ